MRRPKLIFTTITGVLLLLGATYFLVSIFGANLRGATQFSKFPVQSKLHIATECFSEEVSVIPGIKSSHVKPELWVSMSISSENINGCQKVFISSERFSLEEPTFFSGQMNDPFGYLGATPDEGAFTLIDTSNDGYGTNNLSLELRHGQIKNRAFAIKVPLSDLFTQTDIDSWALDLQITIENSNGGLRGWPHFSFIVDDDLSISETNVKPIVQIEPENVRVYRADLVAAMDGATSTASGRFSLTVNDRDAKVWRDISIFLASTVFGASISVLIECFLSLELYRVFIRQQKSNPAVFQSLRNNRRENRPKADD